MERAKGANTSKSINRAITNGVTINEGKAEVLMNKIGSLFSCYLNKLFDQKKQTGIYREISKKL
jgi:hypothetical protein